jgi:catechol 1,2-dioxygenase
MELGPYHRDGTPWRKDLCAPTEAGTGLMVTGCVYGADTCEPLGDVEIDVWQADTKGHYDFQDDPPPASPAFFRMRGRLLSDRGGRYGFSSIVPGNYKAGGENFRAKHVHYLVTRSGYEPLITQLYFEGDPWNAKDPLVRKSLTMPLRPVAGGRQAMTFDLVLRRERPVDAAALRGFGDFLGEYAAGDLLLKVAWDSGHLQAAMGSDRTGLRFEAPNRFFAPEWAAWLTFVRDDAGQVAEVLGELDDGRRGRLKKVR